MMRSLAVFLSLAIALGIGYIYLSPSHESLNHRTEQNPSVPLRDYPAATDSFAMEDSEGPDKPSLAQFKQMLEEGRYEAAAALCESAELESPELFATFQRAYIEQLKSWLKSEDYAKVVSLTDVFRESWYNDFYTLVYLAAACSHLGDFRCTIDAYYSAILYGIDAQEGGIARKNLDLFMSKTDELWSKGQRWEELITLYEHALGWEPDKATYYLRLAEIHLELGDFATAENQLASVHPGSTGSQRLAKIRAAIDQETLIERGIPLTRKGNHYLVDVLLNGIPARLMIDTGASVSALSRDAADQLVDRAGLRRQGEAQLSTAGGRISSPVYLADTVSIDRHDLYGVEWVVIDYPDDNVDGVLGMNVLRQFDFKLDQQRQLLLLQPR